MTHFKPELSLRHHKNVTTESGQAFQNRIRQFNITKQFQLIVFYMQDI